MTAEGRRAGCSRRAKPDEHHARLALRGNRRSGFYADNTTEPGVPIDPEAAQRAFEDALELVRRSCGARLPSCDRRRARPPGRAARGVASASRQGLCVTKVTSFRYEPLPDELPVSWEEIEAELLVAPDRRRRCASCSARRAGLLYSAGTRPARLSRIRRATACPTSST